MLEQPSVPDWIRGFSYPGWTNVFQIVPGNENLYPATLRDDWKVEFNDWNGNILLLAKDGCPTRVIHESVRKGEMLPWRYAQRELGDEGGWPTNERLYSLCSLIPGGKLYGSATANILFDDPGWSRALKGFSSGQLQEFLQRVLSWVVQAMPRIEWIACLGQEAWLLTCTTLGDSFAANQFKKYRDQGWPVVGILGDKKICAFPLFHPKARISNELMNNGWRTFAANVKGRKTR